MHLHFFSLSKLKKKDKPYDLQLLLFILFSFYFLFSFAMFCMQHTVWDLLLNTFCVNRKKRSKKFKISFENNVSVNSLLDIIWGFLKILTWYYLESKLCQSFYIINLSLLWIPKGFMLIYICSDFTFSFKAS